VIHKYREMAKNPASLLGLAIPQGPVERELGDGNLLVIGTSFY
jgi:hypothetical protein